MESRKRKASGLVLAMFSLSLIIVTLGVYSATRTENVSIAGYIPGVVVSGIYARIYINHVCMCLNKHKKQNSRTLVVTCVGSYLCIFFGVLGLFLRENRKQLLVASIVSLFFLVIDGVFLLFRFDMRPLKAGRCKFYTCGNDYIYENYYSQVPYQGLMESCHMSVRSGTCHCCDQYNCANGGYLNHHYQFVGVQSCQDVLLLYRAMWILIVLYLVAFGLGVFTAAVLGGIKDQKYCSITKGTGRQPSAPCPRQYRPHLPHCPPAVPPHPPPHQSSPFNIWHHLATGSSEAGY
ncbi:transmembrane protein 255B [Paramormyrops kingsleyae]|uniref:transmembrane protein 255B n=1 Tax=Paramormyrops kingsleyae TaxID=1676925 RepID=UPI000CD5D383|nr:transmembrane protein 255B-like [Paramormyrops kingsleyae]